jgi:predicted deacetylase
VKEKPGRTSSAELAIVTGSGISVISRPEPMPELTSEQAIEWRQVVNRLPADWFPRETWGLLAQYCRHVVAARRVAQLVTQAEKTEPFNIESYDRLLKMQEREGRAISSLATRMRLSQGASYDKKRKKPLEPISKPWQPEG